MYVDFERKMMFFHNPKTAGLSTMHSLGFEQDAQFKLNHLFPSEAKRCIFQDGWTSFFKFSFARDPWDRMVSLYEYQRSTGYALFDRFSASHGLARNYQFDEWLEINLSGLRRSNHFGVAQSRWHEGVDVVYKFEDYEASLLAICERFQMPCHLRSENRTAHTYYRDYYKHAWMVDAVAKIDVDVISRFGYTF